MKRVFIFPITIIAVLIIGIVTYGCAENPPFAPFGSTVEILTEDLDLILPPDSILVVNFEALVLDPEGTAPLNGVVVTWDLFFAGINAFLVDTDGDGVPDSRVAQLVNLNFCGSPLCPPTIIPQLFELGAFVDSPFNTVTDDRGIARVGVLVSGSFPFEATMSASTNSGSVDIVDITLDLP